MKLIRNSTDLETEDCGGDAASDDGGGAVVLVGVRLDSRSKELLTWALVKVARSGDRVFAVHVLDPNTEGKSTLLSLVQTFNSVLAAYQGFCNLKQIDLKLKICRGSSVRKVLVREAKSYGTANVIVGNSKTHHSILSSVSVAKYCAKHLPKNFTVCAVDNGKILFQRRASDPVLCHSQGDDQNKHHILSTHHSWKRAKVLDNAMTDASASKSNKGQLHSQKFNSTDKLNRGTAENSLALVQAKNQLLSEATPGWALLRRMFLPNQKSSEKSSLKKTVMQWVLKLPSQESSVAVYPECKKSHSYGNDDHSMSLDRASGAIVPLRTLNALSPSSPGYYMKNLSKELEELTEKYSSVCRLFSYQELLLATSNFSPERIAGKGGSSQVFRGCLPDGKELAVKVLKPSEDVFRQFVLEIEIITNVHHKNALSLVGFCFEGNNLVLVYDFLSRGSLEENLHGNRRNEMEFGWKDRYKVALGIAEALNYLHIGAAEPVIHGDVKSSNILLSDDFEPQLSDFGLAIRPSDSSRLVTCADIAGTFGYLAPEYFLHGKVNDRVDVYAFGVVLLELLSGRKPIDSTNPKGQESLVMWAKSIVKDGKISQLLDPSLCGNYDHDQSDRMVLAAALCLKRSPSVRPQISFVLKLLQGDSEVTEWARQQISASEEFDDVDGEEFPINMQSHLNLAMLDFEEDSLSMGSSDQSVLVDDYLQGRCSHSSSLGQPISLASPM